jgi:hypothetical protein
MPRLARLAGVAPHDGVWLCHIVRRKGEIMKNIIVIIISILVFCKVNSLYAEGIKMSKKSQHFEIVKNVVEKLGYDTTKMTCKDQTLVWKDHLLEKNNTNHKLLGKLGRKKFVAVYCYPNEKSLGGNVTVFIDTSNDHVIDILGGQ